MIRRVTYRVSIDAPFVVTRAVYDEIGDVISCMWLGPSRRPTAFSSVADAEAEIARRIASDAAACASLCLPFVTCGHTLTVTFGDAVA